MIHKRIIITAPVLAVAALALTSTESNAKVLPYPDPAAVAPHDPDPSTSAVPAQPGNTIVADDDTTAEALQAGASGLGGAGLAFAAMWLYRRRQTHIA